jgi:C_GCAxxG_C_C family probable redox protein
MTSIRVQRAVDLFEEGYSCSQAVTAAFADLFHLERDIALRISAGLGGGIGRTGSVCGAVTGAILILGLKFGVTDPKDKAGKLAAYEKVRLFGDRFRERTGSSICKDLLGFEFNTPEGTIRSQQPGAFERCPQLIQTAAEILESLLEG